MRKIWGVITVENVTINYPSLGRPALDNVSFTLQSGEFAFLIGSSGSGKTSFFRALLREEKLSHGKIFLGDFPVHKIPQRKIPILRQSLGCIFQDFRLLPDRTVGENIAFSLEVIGKTKSYIYQRVPEVLEEVGLSGKMHRLPHELSGGEQQRTAIARAIANKPLMVLADEPTGNLDPETSTEIVDVLDRINRGGTTVLMATHDRQIVNLLRTRVLELHQGKLVRDEERGTYSISKN